MRTLAVMHLAEVTGPAVSLYPRLAALAERGVVETLVSSPGPVADMYAQIGPVSVQPYATLTVPKSARELAATAAGFVRDVGVLSRHVDRCRPDLVVVATSTLPAALLSARLSGVPAIVYVAEILTGAHSPSRSREQLRRPLLWFTQAAADAVVCASDAVARQFGVAGKRTVIIYPGVAAGAGGRRDEARRRLDVPAGAFCFSVVGSITAGKGQDVAIQALARVLRVDPDAYCLVAGVPHPRTVDRAYAREIVELTRALRVEHRVRFLGFADRTDVYAASDVLCHPSRVPEAFARVVFEAIASSCPVVVARVGALPELLTHNENALLVAPADPDALAGAILRVRSEPALAARLVAGGEDLVGRYSEAAGVEAFTKLVDTVVSRRRSRRPSYTGGSNRPPT